MALLGTKYSINIKPSQQSFTIKSFLQPDLSLFDLDRVSIIWYRQPPPPYETQELAFNFNKTTYKCSSLDYECSVVCKVVGQNDRLVERFDYGPIQTFLYNRLSTSLELRVQVRLFGVWKKCTLTFSPSPALINSQNSNKYQLTQQDIRSIYLKPESSIDHPQSPQQLSTIHTQMKKTIVVENLFQRLILLKLFHEIPNGMYCFSMEVLEVAFSDESACSMALLAINRHKYMKRQQSEVSKSMYNQSPQQELALSKFMKKSNDSFSGLKVNDYQQSSSASLKNTSQETMKKEFLPLAAFTNWRKSPKQSINSASESIVSGNSSKANESRTSLVPPTFDISRNSQNKCEGENKLNHNNNTKKSPASQSGSELKSRVSMKQPKISILSTDINSTTKQSRQQKVSFPEAPPLLASNLKSSQLLIKPKQFKSSLSLRRSQQEIKTPRMDADDDQQLLGGNHNPGGKLPGPIQKKSASQIEVPSQNEQQEQNEYVDQFENLLFEAGEEENNKETELCLNDSFAKLEEEEEKEKMEGIVIVSSPSVEQSFNQQPKRQSMTESMIQHISPPSPTKSQRNVIVLKQTLIAILQQNYELKQKNEQLKRSAHEFNINGDKVGEISKFQEQIVKMKEIQQNLVEEIEKMKRESLISISDKIDKSNTYHSIKSSNQPLQSIQTSHQVQSPQQSSIQSPQHTSSSPTKLVRELESYPKKRIEYKQYVNSLFSPPRQSKNNDIKLSYKYGQPNSPTTLFGARRSQEQEYSSASFIALGREQIQQASSSPTKIYSHLQNIKNYSPEKRYPPLSSNINASTFVNPQSSILNSGDSRFMRLQQDTEYQKFRNNQSYSYKQTEPIRFDQKRQHPKEYPYRN